MEALGSKSASVEYVMPFKDQALKWPYVASTVFSLSKEVTRPAQNQEEGNGLHLLWEVRHGFIEIGEIFGDYLCRQFITLSVLYL